MTKFAWMCATEAYQPEVLLGHAREAERAGFDAIVVPDAFVPWTAEGAAGFTWAWLGAVAALTERIELVTAVTAPLLRYHPAVIAQASATMDRLSGGRFVLGVGTGEPIHDASLGWPRVGYAERAARLREAIEIIRALWSGARVTREGTYYRVDGARLFSPPQHPLRLWMGAAGPRSARLAGDMADGLVASVRDPGSTRRAVLDPFREARGGRPGTVMAARWVVLGGDDEEAWRALGPMRGLRAPARGRVMDPEDLQRSADLADRAEILGRFAVARTLPEVASMYLPLISELRPDYVSIQVATPTPEATLAAIGEEVLPRLRR